MQVNVKYKSEGLTWDKCPGKTLTFFDRNAAIDFANSLSRLLDTEVRLGFTDMTGNCNDNGVYIWKQ